LLGELEDSLVDEACGQQVERDRQVALFHKASLSYPPFIFKHPLQRPIHHTRYTTTHLTKHTHHRGQLSRIRRLIHQPYAHLPHTTHPMRSPKHATPTTPPLPPPNPNAITTPPHLTRQRVYPHLQVAPLERTLHPLTQLDPARPPTPTHKHHLLPQAHLLAPSTPRQTLPCACCGAASARTAIGRNT